MDKNDEDINTKYGWMMSSLVRPIIHLRSYDKVDRGETWVKLQREIFNNSARIIMVVA